MCRLTVQTKSAVKIFNGVTILLIVIVLMAGCNDKLVTYKPTTNIGTLADLTFPTADDDARYQCLLSEATASAASRGLTAMPVIYRAIPPPRSRSLCYMV
jgi:predicted acyltransferase